MRVISIPSVVVAALLSTGLPANAQQTMRVKVGVHPDIAGAVSQSRINDVLAAASALLREKSNRNPDVACPMSFTLQGSVTADPRIPDDFSGFANFQAARALGYQFIILPTIQNCAGGPALGCTWIGGGVITTTGTDARNPVVVAHEFGHARGLDDGDTVGRVMERYARPGNDAVDQPECDAYTNAVGAAVSPGTEPRLPFPPPVSSLTLEELLSGAGFLHGVISALPSIKARCGEDLGPAREAARGPDFGRRRFAFWILGRCGAATDVGVWEDTLGTPITDDIAVLDAKATALQTLGVLLRRTDSPQAASTLASYAVPGPAVATVLAPGTVPPPISPTLVQRRIQSAALRGQALSGRLLTSLPNQPSPVLNPSAFNMSANVAGQLTEVNRLAVAGDIDIAIEAGLRLQLP